jgi:AcrR family transcriptional regulator
LPPKKGTPNRRGVERRAEILEAATELFALKGYRGTSTLDVAKRVGMTHVGVLHHFKTKEDLLRAVVARRDEASDFLQRESEVLTPDEFNERYLTGEGGGLLEPELLTRLVVVLRGENLNAGDPLHRHFDHRAKRTRAFLAASIRSGQERGEYRHDVDPEIKAAEILAFLFGLETEWALNTRAIDRRAVFISYMRGLQTDLRAKTEAVSSD